MSGEIDRYVELYYPAYREGHLLERGGIGDQPARYMELIRLIAETQVSVDAKWDELKQQQES